MMSLFDMRLDLELKTVSQLDYYDPRTMLSYQTSV